MKRFENYYICFVHQLSTELQNQYYHTRQYWMRRRLSLDNFNAEKSQCDDNSYVVATLTNNNEIIGGLRGTAGRTGSLQLLPYEVSLKKQGNIEFRFRDYFPDHYQTECSIGEISRLFVVGDHPDIKLANDIAKQMMKYLIRGHQIDNLCYIYQIASKVHMPLYLHIMRRLGSSYRYKKLHNNHILESITPLENSHGGYYVIACDVSQLSGV